MSEGGARSGQTPELSDAEEAADYLTWSALMRGELNALLTHIRDGNSIRPDSYVAEFLGNALSGAGEFKLTLSTPGLRRPWFSRWDSLKRRVRIGWYIDARLKRGQKFDDVIADAVREFGIGRKSAEAELTYLRRWLMKSDQAGWTNDPEIVEFCDAYQMVLEEYPNG